jgi:hypothetical protein
MDDRYREMFDRDLQKQTTFENRQKNLRWWERYSPSINNIQVHMMYPDMHPTMVKALNFDTLASGVSTPMTASGFQIFTLDQFNPFAPADTATQERVDGGTYAFGVLISGSVNIYDGGTYAFGLPIPAPSQPSTLNGGTY